MMRKFKYLLKYSLKNRFCKKGFIIGQVIIFLLICLLVNIGNIINAFGGDFEESYQVAVYNSFDETNDVYTNFAEFYKIYDEAGLVTYSMDFDYKTEAWDIESKDTLLQDYDFVLVLTQGDSGELASLLFASSLGVVERTTLTTVLTNVRNYYITLSMDEDQLEDFEILNSQFTLDTHFDTGEDEGLEESILGGLSMFLIFPIFMMLIMVVQMVGMEIIEEKSTRSIEYIISNISPKTHFFTKISSALLWSISQMLLVGIYALIATLIATIVAGVNPFDALNTGLSSSDLTIEDVFIFNNLLNHIPQMLFVLFIFIVCGFIFFTTYTALLSAMSSSSEQFQQAQSPLMLVIIAGFYIGMFGMLFGGSSFVKICGYIPIFSPMLAPMLFVTGQYSFLEVSISFIVLVLATGLSVYFILPLYKASILSYSEEKLIKRIKKIIETTRKDKQRLSAK